MFTQTEQLCTLQEPPAWHARFLSMMPKIRRLAEIAFRRARPDLKHDLVNEAIVNAMVAFLRLVRRGMEDQGFPTTLGKYAVRQILAGRRVGCRVRVRDVMSEAARRCKNVTLQRLDCYDEQAEQWKEAIVEDRHAGPDQIAATRLDFSSWLEQLSQRTRRIALTLAGGATTTETAREFGLSVGRVSQLRRWLMENWLRFQGEFRTDEQPQLAVA